MVSLSNFRSPRIFAAPFKQAKIRASTHEPLSATDGITEPVFRHRRLPTGKRLLLAGEATQARARDRHLPAVIAKLAFRLAPTMRRSVLLRSLPRGERGPRPVRASFSIIRCLDQTGLIKAARQELIAMRRPICPRFDLCARTTRGRSDKSVHALLSSRGLSHPAPTSSRQERRCAYFNNDRDIARSQS